ncbi:MAG: signal peptidase II [Candidatus Hydrogenedentes bacterium]|nr:signal peptidase II [Candidatus Hydrogenedentota bacterium]
MNYKKRLAVVAGILIVSVVLDQITKRMAIAWLMGHPPIIYWGDFFRLQYAENTGAFLGLFGTLSAGTRNLLLIGFNSIILTAVTVFLFLPRKTMNIAVIALALILSGGVGNLIDRIAYSGVVVDFMNMGLPWLKIRGWEPRTGIFNIADLAIVGGLVLMILAEFLKPKEEEESSANKN